MRHLIALLMILISIGCAQLPPPPNVNLCVINYESRRLHCKEVMSKKERDVFLHNADNYISVSPDDWASLQIYLRELKDLAQVRCK